MGSCVQLMVVTGIMGAYVTGISKMYIFFLHLIHAFMQMFPKRKSILEGSRMTVSPNDYQIDIKRKGCFI